MIGLGAAETAGASVWLLPASQAQPWSANMCAKACFVFAQLLANEIIVVADEAIDAVFEQLLFFRKIKIPGCPI